MSFLDKELRIENCKLKIANLACATPSFNLQFTIFNFQFAICNSLSASAVGISSLCRASRFAGASRVRKLADLSQRQPAIGRGQNETACETRKAVGPPGGRKSSDDQIDRRQHKCANLERPRPAIGIAGLIPICQPCEHLAFVGRRGQYQSLCGFD